MNDTIITKREIYPWWNILTKDEKMEIYFKYYSSGTYDDCIEWWERIDIICKIFVFDSWCEDYKKQKLEALLNNTVDDDEAILLERELAGEEAKSDGS